jgi:photosystem II PsbH protein
MNTPNVKDISKNRGKQTVVSDIFKPLNSESGKVAYGWGTTILMSVFMALFAVFLVILLELYNASVTLNDIDVSWD